VGRFRALRLPYAAWVTEEMDALSETPSKHQFPGRKLGLFFNHMKYSVFSRQLFPTLQLQPSIQRMSLISDRRHGVVCREITRENGMKIIISALLALSLAAGVAAPASAGDDCDDTPTYSGH